MLVECRLRNKYEAALMRKPTSISLLAAGAVFLAGCAVSVGNKKDAPTAEPAKTTTVGRELIDLKEARDLDAISEEEYRRLRNEAMKKPE